MSNRLLTPRQLELYSLLDGKDDVLVSRLYKGYYKRAPKAFAEMQSALGWPIASLNKRLALSKQRIVPGKARRSYRLTETK